MAGGVVGLRKVLTVMGNQYHVYAVDKLGMGLTDKPKEDSGYSMQATNQHIYRFMQTLGLENVHLVGHSRGGLPVARIAHRDRLGFQDEQPIGQMDQMRKKDVIHRPMCCRGAESLQTSPIGPHAQLMSDRRPERHQVILPEIPIHSES